GGGGSRHRPSAGQPQRRSVSGALLETLDATAEQVVPDMIGLLVVDARGRAGGSEFDGETADTDLGRGTAPGNALGDAPIMVACFEIHPAVDAGGIETQRRVETAQRL